MKMNRTAAVILAIWLLHLLLFAQSADCPRPAPKTSYTVLSSGRTVAGPERKLIEVYLHRKRFTIEEMISLREQLRYDFCKEDRLRVTFYDTKRPRRVLGIDITGTEEVDVKGRYTFDMDGDEVLSFQSLDKNLWRIVFKDAEYCVYEEN
jgi:hypothetical protein